MTKVFVLSIVLSFISFVGNSQDYSLISATLKKVQQEQVVSDSYFLKGIFPSYLSKYPEYWTKQKDNNVFYNALIAYTLNSLKPSFSNSDQKIVDEIQKQNQFLLPHFENVKGRETFNFSRTDTAFQFPYNKWIPMLRGNLAFPDDLDCTSLVVMSQNLPDSTIHQIHELMQAFTNKGKLKTTYSSYRNDKAYSSWFGKKFPIVLDVSVLCNVLCFVQQK